MEKKNEKAAKNEETVELTAEQIEKVNAAGIPEIMGFHDETDNKDNPWNQY